MKRRFPTFLGALLGALSLMTLATSTSAQATGDLYRYWSYWHSQDSISWTYSNEGATRIPADGTVEGWYFSVTNKSPQAAEALTIRANFSEYCKETKAVNGMKRVAVVVDFGKDSYAPVGQSPAKPVIDCALVPVDANGYDVLNKVAKIRTDSVGFICGINSYPEEGCGEKFTPASTESGPNWGIRILNFGLSVILLLLVYRRIAARRREQP